MRDSDLLTTESGCWLPPGGECPASTASQHVRRLYRLLIGPIAPGEVLVPTCGEQRCMNPNHRQPMSRAQARRRQAATLNIAQVREIRRLRREGVSRAELARRYGVCPATITQIIQRRTWREF